MIYLLNFNNVWTEIKHVVAITAPAKWVSIFLELWAELLWALKIQNISDNSKDLTFYLLEKCMLPTLVKVKATHLKN
jgi:hypothetical protein